MSEILDLLKPNGYIMANKKIIKLFGLHEAILLGALCSRQAMWDECYEAGTWDSSKYGEYDGFHFFTANTIEYETTLSPHQQRNAFNNLEKNGIIKTKLKGMPASKWFRVNENKLMEIFFPSVVENFDNKMSNNLTTSCEKIEQPDVEKSNTNNNIINNNKINNNNTIVKTESDSRIEDIISYLNDVTGQKLKSSSKGHQKYIRARLRDGYTVNDCKVVIDKKWADWEGTEWEKYMKPSTLFAPSHFDEYLNQPMKYKKKSPQSKLQYSQNKPEDHKFVGEIKL